MGACSTIETLRELAPKGQSDPCIVLLTPGVYNSAFYEHMDGAAFLYPLPE